MRRLRAWWAPKEPAERAGLVVLPLLLLGLIVTVIAPQFTAGVVDSFVHSMHLR